MKTYNPILVSILFTGFLIHCSIAQNVSITPGKVQTEESQEVDGWIAHPEQPAEYATKTFESFLKNSMGTKLTRKVRNVLIVEKIKIGEVSSWRGDLRAVVRTGSNGTEIGFIFSPGYDIHFEPTHYPKEYAKLESMVRKYIKYHYSEYYKDQSAKVTKDISTEKSSAEKLESRIAKVKDEMSLNEKKSADGKDAKASEKNAKLQLEADKLNGELTKLQGEITKLEETLNQINASIKKVAEL